MKMFFAAALLAAASFLVPLPIAEQHDASSPPMPGEAQAAMMPARLDASLIAGASSLDESAGLAGRSPEPGTAWMVAAGIFAIIVLRRTSATL